MVWIPKPSKLPHHCLNMWFPFKKASWHIRKHKLLKWKFLLQCYSLTHLNGLQLACCQAKNKIHQQILKPTAHTKLGKLNHYTCIHSCIEWCNFLDLANIMDFLFSLSLLQCIMGFKGILHSKINIMSSFLSPSRLSKLSAFLSSVKYKNIFQ